MKLPSIARTPKPPAGSRWLVAAALNVDLPSIPSYSPKVGDELDADHEFVAFCFAHHATHLLVPAGATTAELRQAYARNLYPNDLPPSTPTTDIQTPGPLPDERRMVCTKALFIGNAAIPAGTIVDSRDQWARTYPGHFAPAPAVSE
jgi:hypothetical protein